MDVVLWRCVIELLCLPAVLTWSVSQSPSSVYLKLNSSTDIYCSTSLTNPSGLYLKGRFHRNREVLYLSIDEGAVKKTTINPRFKDQVAVISLQVKQDCRLTLRLSQLKVEDTDSYYCSWRYYDTNTKKLLVLPSNGTIIIVRERDPGCGITQTNIAVILMCFIQLVILVLIPYFLIRACLQCARMTSRSINTDGLYPESLDSPPDRNKKNFTRARVSERQHHLIPRHVCTQHRSTAEPQFIYSNSFPGNLGFRGML